MYVPSASTEAGGETRGPCSTFCATNVPFTFLLGALKEGHRRYGSGRFERWLLARLFSCLSLCFRAIIVQFLCQSRLKPQVVDNRAMLSDYGCSV